jgi:hypothetical protein
MISYETRRRLPVGVLPTGVGKLGRHLSIASVVILVSALPQKLHALPEVAQADAPAPRTKYRPVIERYRPFRPLDPRSWQGVNQEVTPKPKSNNGHTQQR